LTHFQIDLRKKSAEIVQHPHRWWADHDVSCNGVVQSSLNINSSSNEKSSPLFAQNESLLQDLKGTAGIQKSCSVFDSGSILCFCFSLLLLQITTIRLIPRNHLFRSPHAQWKGSPRRKIQVFSSRLPLYAPQGLWPWATSTVTATATDRINIRRSDKYRCRNLHSMQCASVIPPKLGAANHFRLSRLGVSWVLVYQWWWIILVGPRSAMFM
jgi:hypothetical protein